MASGRSFLGDRDGFLALYYGGGTPGFFMPMDVEPEDEDFEVRFFEGVLERDPEYVEALGHLGNLHTIGGRYQKGLDLDLRLLRLRPDSARANYNIACSYALLDRTEEAMRALSRAVECGFDDPEHMARDEDLKSLRGDPRFAELLVEVREKLGSRV